MFVMIDKYYTPKIEEFHYGFEYEFSLPENVYSDNWLETLGTPDCKPPEVIYKWHKRVWNEHEFRLSKFRSDNVRVKYLDKEDIESLGFKEVPLTRSELQQYKVIQFESLSGNFLIYFWDRDIIQKERMCGDITIKSVTFDSVHHTPIQSDTVFYGFIKNKNELKNVLQLLIGINGKI